MDDSQLTEQKMNIVFKRSVVWEFFYEQKSDPTKAKCKLCCTLLSRGGLGKKATTTSLLNHLKKIHPLEYEALQIKKDNVSACSSAVTEPNANRGIKRKQTTLEEVLTRKKIWDINDSRSVELHRAIAEMIAIDNQPFSFVEDSGFINLMKIAQPCYNVPSREYFKLTVLPKIYKECKESVISQISNAVAVSVTSDIWTSTNNHSFISFTGHWIDDDFIYKHAALSTKHFPGTHCADDISRMIKNAISEWDLSEKLYLVLRDNGANIVKGIKGVDLNSESCFLHTLQLVISDALPSQRVVSDMISTGKRIVTHFNHSSLACSRLSEIQENDLKQKKKILFQDVATRWNSTFYMLQRLHEQKKSISLYATQFGGITNFNSNQWLLLEKCLRLLEPFEQVTVKISSTKSLISEVIPMVQTLKLFLSKPEDEFSGVGTFKHSLAQNMNTRFEHIYNNEHFCVSTLLDPRFKLAFFDKTREYHLKLKSRLILLMAAISNNEIPETNPNVTETSKDVHKESKATFWDYFMEISTTNTTQTADKFQLPTNDECEVSSYFDKSLLDRNECPLNWWKANAIEFPKLSQLARKYLSAPASSVYSERLFSEAGIIYEKKRNRLKPENAEMLLFLHHNMKLFCK